MIDFVEDINEDEKGRLTDKLIECALFDLMPALGGPTDLAFLIDNKMARFGALQWAIRHETTNRVELLKAMGKPELLAEIVHREANLYGSRLTNGYADAYPL